MLYTWDHSWDAVDATTYLDDGKNFDLPEAVRVDSVSDPSGGLVMSRDDFGPRKNIRLFAPPRHSFPAVQSYVRWPTIVVF